jgi:hypothetical protein
VNLFHRISSATQDGTLGFKSATTGGTTRRNTFMYIVSPLSSHQCFSGTHNSNPSSAQRKIKKITATFLFFFLIFMFCFLFLSVVFTGLFCAVFLLFVCFFNLCFVSFDFPFISVLFVYCFFIFILICLLYVFVLFLFLDWRYYFMQFF